MPLEEHALYQEAVGLTPDSRVSDEESCGQQDERP